jgi:acyl-CoA dehydrogenase
MRRVLAWEEAGFGDAALFMSLPGPGLAAPVIHAYGTPEQQKLFFSTFTKTTIPRWAAFAVSEPNAGSDMAAMSTTAQKEKSEYVLNGTKWFVGSGGRATWIVVFATAGRHLGRFGIKAFLVHRDTPGFRATRRLPSLGLRVLGLTELKFENCRLNEKYVLALRGANTRERGFDAALTTFQQFRPLVSSLAIGIARAALEQVEEVVTQNGAKHSGAIHWSLVRERLRTMRTRLHAARLICRKAAWLQDRGLENNAEVSMAKIMSAKVGMEICSEALDIAGKAALADDSLLQKLFRDMKGFDILEGTGEIHRLMLVRHLLRQHAERPEALEQTYATTSGN